MIVPHTRTAAMAYRGHTLRNSMKQSSMDRPSSGDAATDVKTFAPKLNRIPANMPELTAMGMRRMMTSRVPVRPMTVMMAALARYAPTACAKGTPGSMVMSRAAPGVDHAVMMGMRILQLSSRPVRPLPMDTAHIHDVVSSSESPASRAA